jgi:hypothetical protein
MAGNLMTSKDNESYLCFSFQYYVKPPNKDGSIRGVCREKKCHASITLLNNQIIKINGNFVEDVNENNIKMSHKDSHPGLKALSQSKRWQGDGTFSTAPSGFYQLYTLHGLHMWQMITCLWILLSGKSEILNKKMINEIKNGGLKLGLEMRPEVVMMDFELAAMNAFSFHFPRIQIKCCFFHLGQSFYRKLCIEGLKEQYKNDANLRKWVKQVICLALIPVEKVEDVFEQLCMEKPDYNEKIDNFLDYVLLNYIRNDENDRYVFPLEVWNHYESEKRTNNDIEGYNSKLEKFLGTHPNIWLFINKIKAEESTATLKYMRINNDTLSYRKRNAVDVDRDLEIQNAKIRYLTNKINIMEYLNEVSDCVCNYDEV